MIFYEGLAMLSLSLYLALLLEKQRGSLQRMIVFDSYTAISYGTRSIHNRHRQQHTSLGLRCALVVGTSPLLC